MKKRDIADKDKIVYLKFRVRSIIEEYKNIDKEMHEIMRRKKEKPHWYDYVDGQITTWRRLEFILDQITADNDDHSWNTDGIIEYGLSLVDEYRSKYLEEKADL